MDNITKGVLVALAAVLILALGLGIWLLFGDLKPQADDSTAEPVAAETADEPPVEPTENTALTSDSGALPAAVIVELPTNTPLPATETPAPTATPVPTAVPPTNTPVPIPPTNVPVSIPPTNTSVPPTAVPTPAPSGAAGLIASHFALQSRSQFVVNKAIWFEFTVSNSTGGDVAYNAIGVMPKKDGVDRQDWYQQTYGGPNAKVRPGGLSWEDNIKIPETGNMTLRLVICFDGFNTCLAGGGTWRSLSPEIPITIN